MNTETKMTDEQALNILLLLRNDAAVGLAQWGVGEHRALDHIAARLRGEGAQGDYHEGLAEGIKIGRSEVMAEQQGQAAFWTTQYDLLRAEHEGDNVTACPDVGNAPDDAVLLYTRPQPVGGDAVRALADELMLASEQEDDRAAGIAFADAAGRVRTLAAALSAAPAAPAPVAGDAVTKAVGQMVELAKVSRRYGTYAPYSLEVIAKNLQSALAQDRASQGAATGVPEDFITHQGSWRKALKTLQEETEARGAADDANYWAHELRAFDRAYAELLAAAPKPTAGEKAHG